MKKLYTTTPVASDLWVSPRDWERAMLSLIDQNSTDYQEGIRIYKVTGSYETYFRFRTRIIIRCSAGLLLDGTWRDSESDNRRPWNFGCALMHLEAENQITGELYKREDRDNVLHQSVQTTA